MMTHGLISVLCIQIPEEHGHFKWGALLTGS